MIGIEILYHLHKASHNPIALKLGLSKAFDRIEWDLVLYALQRMNFPERIVSLISTCISSSHIAIRYNNSKTSYFKPLRGLCQGDHLSPLLLILCMQSLTSLIKKAEFNGEWFPAFPRKRALNISYLLFVDDAILFTRGFPAALHNTHELILQCNRK